MASDYEKKNVGMNIGTILADLMAANELIEIPVLSWTSIRIQVTRLFTAW